MDALKPTKEEIQEGLALLRKKIERDEKIKRGELKPSYKKVADMSPKEKEAYQLANRKSSIRVKLMLAKAKAAGIVVTEAEIDAELAKTA